MLPTDSSLLAAARRVPVASDMAIPPACLIVGLGNCLLRDDGIGVHAVRQLATDPPASSLLLEAGTDIFSAVFWLERVPRVLVIDAMDAGGMPGTIYLCDSHQVRVDAVRTSLHEMGLLSVLEFVPAEKRPAITVLGVQPALIDFGLELSPALQAVLPAVVEATRSVIAGWQPLPVNVPRGWRFPAARGTDRKAAQNIG